MMPESVARAREAFRQNRIPENYSGPLHLATVIGISVLVAAASLVMLDDVGPVEWLAIPLTFLYCNLAEYLGHRGPMHKKIRFLSGIFQRHTVEHHSFFTDEAISFDSPRDYRAVLFPPILLIFFFGFFAVPIGALLYFLVSPNVCFLFVFTAILYYLNYELFHFSYHVDPQSWLGRLQLIRQLREHHLAHHNKALMTRCNFNITYPICDRLFGTLYRGDERSEEP
jgi:sterol desaturase/sphingolipid hydroxylase (fatty acid hydroxylase superfamily)